jgi:hypothetical protein
MAKSVDPLYYQVKKVGPVEGPVGMDIGVWLHFETDRGKVTLKLSHEDAAVLQGRLDQEPSIRRGHQKAD